MLFIIHIHTPGLSTQTPLSPTIEHTMVAQVSLFIITFPSAHPRTPE